MVYRLMDIQRLIPLIDDILGGWLPELGPDFISYKGHCYRVYNFCRVLSGAEGIDLEKIGISAAFHDLGIWTAKTFDYLEPSKKLAHDFLVRTGRHEMLIEIEAMIDNHHKITTFRGKDGGLIEYFRMADLVDVSFGLINYTLPRSFVRKVLSVFPNNGFHKRLLALTMQRMKRHPFTPLPMIKF